MPVEQNKIDIVFDFDDTLTEDTLTRLPTRYGVDANAFWLEDVASLSEDGWDPPLGYMKAMLDLTKNNGALSLSSLKNSDLFEFGQTLDFYEGVRQFLDQIPVCLGSQPDWVEAEVNVEFYIVTGGLQEIVDGCPIRDSFRDVWGCSFQGDASTGVISFPKNSMTFTDKTRFLFQINKGIVGPDSRTNPNAVNKDVSPEERPIPFHNMIYIGDGLTDIPCFSLVESGNGVGRVCKVGDGD